MDYKRIGFGLGAFALGAAAWVGGAAAFGPKPGSRGFRARGDDDSGGGVMSGDSTTGPLAAEPADRAAAPVGRAEADKHFKEQPGNPAAEHVPTDLLGDSHPGADGRAPDAFRPDPTAVPTAEEREALRPATGPAPTLVADRGSDVGGAAGAA